MPELPEVETVRRGLADVMQNAYIIKAEQNRVDLRFPFTKNLVDIIEGCQIIELKRRAKYLVFYLNNGYAIISHLGMSGSFRIIRDEIEHCPVIRDKIEHCPGKFTHPKQKNQKHDHFIFHLKNNGTSSQVIYNDPRRFGFILLVEQNELDQHPFLKNLGVEPTGNGIDIAYLADKFKGKNVSIKSALLDQKIIAGLGNIYACEALWHSRLSPLIQVKTLVTPKGRAKSELSGLIYHIQHVIADAISAGGSSLNDHIQANGDLGYFQHHFKVYNRQDKSCYHSDCNGYIKRITQNGRSTFFCPQCQK